VLREAAVLALGLALTAAAWQDVKTREVDVRIFAAAGAAAAVLMWLNWGNPLYTLSLAVGALLALLTRLLGAGYADSTALALISTGLHSLPPGPLHSGYGRLRVASGGYAVALREEPRPPLQNGRVGEADPHMRLARGICKKPEIRRRRRQRPRDDPSMIKGWVKAKYGLPYVLHPAAGFWIYVALFLTPP
jgi:preflagellin peptidase FlaK